MQDLHLYSVSAYVVEPQRVLMDLRVGGNFQTVATAADRAGWDRAVSTQSGGKLCIRQLTRHIHDLLMLDLLVSGAPGL